MLRRLSRLVLLVALVGVDEGASPSGLRTGGDPTGPASQADDPDHHMENESGSVGGRPEVTIVAPSSMAARIPPR